MRRRTKRVVRKVGGNAYLFFTLEFLEICLLKVAIFARPVLKTCRNVHVPVAQFIAAKDPAVTIVRV